MSKYTNKAIEGIELYLYLQTRFNMSPEEALQEMKDHNQDVTAVEKAISMAKQQQKTEGKNQ